MTKLEKLAKIEGSTIESLLEEAVMGNNCKGICMNKSCDYTTNIEPDQEKGYCEICGTNTVKSVCILTGII